MNILALHVTKCEFIKVAVMSIKENGLVVDIGGPTYGRELGHDFKTLINIYISGWFVVDYPISDIRQASLIRL